MNKKFQRELESSAEYVLPDYLGEVKKLLSSSARAVPSGKFVGDDRLESVGVVQYELIYLDSENKLSAASFTSDYEMSQEIDESYRDSYIRCAISSYSIRLTGPRRISAKANVAVDVITSCDDDIAVLGTAFDGTYSPKLSYSKVMIEKMRSSDTLEREYAEETLHVDGVNADEIEIVSNGAFVKINEAEAVDGGVRVKGNISFVSIIRVNSEPPFAITREIPFEETIEINDSPSGASALADAYISSVTASVNDVEGGASVVANLIMDISALTLENEEREIAADSYLCERDTEERYEKFKYTEHICSYRFGVSCALKLPVTDHLPEGFSEFLTLNAVFRAAELDNAGAEPQIKAEAQFSGIACEINAENESNLIPVKFSAPISFSVNNNCHNIEKGTLSLKIAPCPVEWSIDADKLMLKCNTDVRLTSSMEKSCDRLTASDIVGDNIYEPSSATIKVYYPEEGETLYTVAKKFHTTTEAIAVANNISAEVSTLGDGVDIKRLIID